MKTLKRSIHFYVAVDRFTNAVLSKDVLIQIAKQLNDACKDPKSAYVKVENEDQCRPWMDHSKFPIKFRFGKTRVNGLPQIEGEGNFRPIQLSKGEGVNDLSHLVLFENGVLGHEFNWHAPRIGSFAYYIQEKIGPKIKFIPLLNPSAAQRLSELNELYAFEFEVRSKELERMELSSMSLKKSIENLAEFGGNHNIRVSITADRRSDEKLKDKVLNVFKKFSGTMDKQEIKKLTVKGFNPQTGKIDEIDLLREYLVAKESVVSENKKLRTVNSTSAYKAIASAYETLKADIQGALNGL